MDPLADKILVISALVVFVEIGALPSWISIVVLAREFLIGGIRSLAAANGEVIPAGNLGKYKTTTQMIGIIIIIALGATPIRFLGVHLNVWIMLPSVILTIWSGWDYSVKAKHYFMNME
jgi:CDP-diacylglycerol--glycerol-3-phosphate 3-phosphatidyltransferase